MLPSTFEVDHVIPLHRGGSDDIETNAMPLCPGCHRDKSQRERIQMMEIQRAERHAEEARLRSQWEADTRMREEAKIRLCAIGDGISQCSECKAKFYDLFKHTKCAAVERRINLALGRRGAIEADLNQNNAVQATNCRSSPVLPLLGTALFEQFKYKPS